MLDFEISVIVGNRGYRLKKSRSTVIRHLYGKINQNTPKSNLQNQIKRESEQQKRNTICAKENELTFVLSLS